MKTIKMYGLFLIMGLFTTNIMGQATQANGSIGIEQQLKDAIQDPNLSDEQRTKAERMLKDMTAEETKPTPQQQKTSEEVKEPKTTEQPLTFEFNPNTYIPENHSTTMDVEDLEHYVNAYENGDIPKETITNLITDGHLNLAICNRHGVDQNSKLYKEVAATTNQGTSK